jgi:betaine-aldehyde dehydrogenase
MDHVLSAPGIRRYTQLVSGVWTPPGSQSVIRTDPATQEPVGEYYMASSAAVFAATGAAKAELVSGFWSGMTGAERGRVLLKWATLIRENHYMLAGIEAREVGKPIRVALADIAGVADITEYAATLAFDIQGGAYDKINGRDLAVIMREPVGVVAAIVPWNFPAIVYSQKVPFALAAGCTVVVKPSELTPGTAFELSLLAHKAGVPGDALHVVMGGPEVGRELTTHPDVAMVTFTGSTAVGSQIAAAVAPLHKRFALELGGKGGAIVLGDANLDDALDGVLFGAFNNQGETCCADTRLILQDSIADTFVSRLSARCNALVVGDTLDPRTDIGPMVSQAHFERVLSFIDEGLREGANLAAGGRASGEGLAKGYFIRPTVLDQVQPSMRVFKEEIFGPVLTVTRVKTFEQALEVANDTDYGLASSVWTKDIDKAISAGRALRSGSVWVNTTLDGAPQLPFGGFKASGLSREKGRAGLDEFLTTKCLHIHVGDRAPAYPALASQSAL